MLDGSGVLDPDTVDEDKNGIDAAVEVDRFRLRGCDGVGAAKTGNADKTMASTVTRYSAFRCMIFPFHQGVIYLAYPQCASTVMVLPQLVCDNSCSPQQLDSNRADDAPKRSAVHRRQG